MNGGVRALFASLAIAGGLLGVAHGCSSSSTSEGKAVGFEAATDAGSLFDIFVTDAPHCSIPPKPAGVPEGWELYTDYDPCCLLYTPSAPEYLPPPLQWTTCNSAWMGTGDAGLNGGGCRTIDQTTAGSPVAGASVRNGVVSLLTGVFINNFYVDVLAEADGPIHQALLETNRKASQCTPAPQDMRDGKYVYAMYPPNDFNGGGFIAGDVDEFRPSFVHHHSDSQTHGVLVGELGVLDVDETDAFRLYEWAQTPIVITRNPRDIGLAYSFPAFASDALFWVASAGPYDRIAAYTNDAGATDLISFGSDSSRGVADIGSDGVDLVWMEGTGHVADPVGFDSAMLMTSPFATDSSKVIARRLRSESPQSFGVSTTKVGCGYAARTNDNYLRIVRLSDGVSWVLGNSRPSWTWINALALTCDEVFVTVFVGTNANIARVKISSLGPGTPPD